MRIIIVLALYAFNVIQCARILGVFPVGGTSHHTAGVTLMKILAEKGHDITMVSPLPAKGLPRNFKEVVLPSEEKNDVDFYSFNVHPYLQYYIYNSLGPNFVNSVLSHAKFRELLNANETYDVIILEQFYSDGLKYLGYRLKAPLILYSALDAGPWTNPSVGNPAPPSYVPDTLLPYTNDMTFFQRMNNFIFFVVSELIRNFVVLPAHDKIVKQNFPEAPDISEYYNNPAIVLLNGDTSVNSPIPKVPSMIDIGGFHIKPSKPLPTDLQSILDNAKNGVVYFSLGSNIKSADMPKKTLAALINVFSSLKETVLWKWENEELAGKPDNVVIRKWLPQNDVFAHKNIKLFITHGGIFSTLEAVYHGIPCLAFPIFGDQTMNAKRATSNGYARWMPFSEITEEQLKYDIQEMLSNSKYSENAKKRSVILRDKPRKPADTLSFWVEYVIKHKGADHLRVASLKLTWYQYVLLDVIAFIAICSLLFIVFVKYCTKSLMRFCKKSNRKQKQQ